jgi:hypothetical protein
VVLAVGFAAAWVAVERQLVASARGEVLQNARIMMAAANAVRTESPVNNAKRRRIP